MVRVSSYDYSKATPLPKTETHGKSAGSKKTRITFKGFEDERYKIHAKNFKEGETRRLDPITARRYVAIHITHPHGHKKGTILLNINSLAKRFNLKATDIRKAYKNGTLESMLDEKIRGSLKEKLGESQRKSRGEGEWVYPETTAKDKEKVSSPSRVANKTSSSKSRKASSNFKSSKSKEDKAPLKRKTKSEKTRSSSSKTKAASSSKPKSKGVGQRLRAAFDVSSKPEKERRTPERSGKHTPPNYPLPMRPDEI